MFPIASLITAAGSFAGANNTNEATHSGISNAKKTLAGTEGYADALKMNGEQILSQMLGSNRAIYGTPEQTALELQQAKQAMNGIDPYQAGQFDYSKEISDFYDPAFQLSVNTANDSVNGSQALGGNLFSSDTADKIAAQNQVLATNMYDEALRAYQADKGLEQNIWQGNEAAKQAAASSAANLAGTKYDMASDAASNLSAGDTAYYQALMGLNDDYFANKTAYAAQLAGLEAQDPGHRNWFSRTFDPAGFFLS